jgi:hypothetical protein
VRHTSYEGSDRYRPFLHRKVLLTARGKPIRITNKDKEVVCGTDSWNAPPVS